MAQPLAPMPVAWETAVDQYALDLTTRRQAARTIEIRTYHLLRFALAYPNGPERLTRQQVLNYIAQPLWSNNTFNVVHATLKGFFKWAQKHGVITKDLVAALPPAQRQMGTASRPASQADVDAALASAKPDVKLMLLLIAVAGLKPVEISHLHSRQIETNADGTHIAVVRTDSGRTREVRLRRDLAEAVLARPVGYAFPGQVNGHISPAYVSRLISQTLPEGKSAVQVRRTFEEGKLTLAWSALASYHSPQAMRLSEHPDFKDSQAVAQHLAKLEAALRSGAADVAIGACKNLLEAVFKAVLDGEGVAYEKDKLPAMFNKVADALTNAADDPIRDSIRTTMRSLSAVVQSVAEIRNTMGDAHDSNVPADARHARLVFNATVTVAEYVADTWSCRLPRGLTVTSWSLPSLRGGREGRRPPPL